MTPQEALDKTKIKLMSSKDSVFFATVCFNLKHSWDNTIGTAATNGKEIKFNPDFFMSLTPDERLFLLLHETLHVAFLHTVRVGTMDKKKYNIAGDHVINLILKEKGFRMPANGLADPQYKGMSTEEVYNLLPDPPEDDNFECDINESLDEETQAEIQDIVVRASIQSKMSNESPGAIPGEIQIFLDKLLNPKLPWFQILRKYMQATKQHDYSFQKANRRYLPDHYLPSLHSEGMIDLAIAVDTSGSVSDDEFLVFVSEIAGIIKSFKPDKIDLIQFDTEIKSITPVSNLNLLKNVEFTGRGGTEIVPVMEWVNKHKPKVLLVFTDGDFYFEDSSTKVTTFWLIHNNKRFTSKFGKVIHYEI